MTTSVFGLSSTSIPLSTLENIYTTTTVTWTTSSGRSEERRRTPPPPLPTPPPLTLSNAEKCLRDLSALKTITGLGWKASPSQALNTPLTPFSRPPSHQRFPHILHIPHPFHQKFPPTLPIPPPSHQRSHHTLPIPPPSHQNSLPTPPSPLTILLAVLTLLSVLSVTKHSL